MSTLKVCNLCEQSTCTQGNDIIFFGEWMTKSDITVHYFCLLLSTNLPQHGKSDNAGILGFLLRDIRQEIEKAKSRTCIYCGKTHATIMCSGCKDYFHLTCGFTALSLSQFKDDFRTYCDRCIPQDDVWEKLKKENPPVSKYKCNICMALMGVCVPSKWIYAKCCGNGYVHSLCMKSYALKAGYYLRCLWCRDTRFREYVKDMNVFVPDRDANWEQEEGAYQDLHRGHHRCDMEVCNSPKGREYNNGRSWKIIICQLCGSFGAHNPKCIPGMASVKDKVKVFKCEICSATERTILFESTLTESVFDNDSDGIDTTLYIQKDIQPSDVRQQTSAVVDFSEDTNSIKSQPQASVCQTEPLASGTENTIRPDPEAIESAVKRLLNLFEP